MIHDLKQIPTLALIAVGSRVPESWHAKPQIMDFFDFKGEVEEILAAGRVKAEFVRTERAWLHPRAICGNCGGWTVDWLLGAFTPVTGK